MPELKQATKLSTTTTISYITNVILFTYWGKGMNPSHLDNQKQIKFAAYQMNTVS